jgi:phosphatidylglycerophosphate synthase
MRVTHKAGWFRANSRFPTAHALPGPVNTVIDTIIVLADETASCVVAGLPQLERLIRDIQRSWPASRSDANRPPEVIVVWRSPRSSERQQQQPGDAGRRPIGIRVRHLIDGDGDHSELLDLNGLERTRVLSTRQVWSPRGLAGHFASQPTDNSELVGGGLWEILTRKLSTAHANESGRDHDGLVGLLGGCADVPRVERALFRSLGNPSDGYMTRLVHRRLSTRVSRLLARTTITPNQITCVVGTLFLASAWSLVTSGYWMLLVGTILYKLGDILDGCDGELSRVKFLQSRFGAWFDTTVDMIGNMLFMGALGVGLSRYPGLLEGERMLYLWEGLLVVSAMALAIWGMVRYTRTTSGAAHFSGFGTSLASSAPDYRGIRRLILVGSRLLRRDAYSWLFVALAATGHPAWILHAQAGGLVVYFLALWYADRVQSAKRC